MISGAEAHRIGRALQSVSAWVAEIVVVLDENVNDGTEQIALHHGAKVFREPWKGFIGQKNSASEKAMQPWVLNLDADEVVSPDLAQEIANVVKGSAALHAAYEFPRCTFYCGRWIRHGDWYPDRVRRLWRKGAATWGGLEPHAQLEVTGSIGRLCSDLQHFTNESIARHVQKVVTYSDDFVRQKAGRGYQPGLFGLLVRPLWRFLRAYFFRLGFLDGWQGYYIAWVSAFSVVTKYARLLEPSAGRSGNDGER